jgi:hypothetical protein
MLFRKNVYQKIEDIAAKIDIEPDDFLCIPDVGCKIAENTLELHSSGPAVLNFAEAQLLTKKLSKDYDLDIRMPRSIEGYIASQKLDIKNRQYEWRSELIDGSFLMLNPDVRSVSNPRRYDFCSNNMSLVEISGYSRPRNNGDMFWLGISKDEYDRSALVSSFGEKSYSVGAIPPLSKDCLGVRLLIDENKKRYK